MLGSNLHPYVGKMAVAPVRQSIADRFAEVVVRLHLEYDLSSDILAVAQDVLQALKARDLQALKAREKHWPLQQLEMSGLAHMQRAAVNQLAIPANSAYPRSSTSILAAG